MYIKFNKYHYVIKNQLQIFILLTLYKNQPNFNQSNWIETQVMHSVQYKKRVWYVHVW